MSFHDHIRLRQHQTVAITYIGVRLGARHMEHRGTTESSKAVGGPSGSSQLSPGGRPAEMISYGRTNANRKVLIKCLGENLLPTAQTWLFGWQGSLVAAPGTGNSHIDLLCYLGPGQAMVAKLKDLLRGTRMSGGTAPTHGDAGTTKLMAHCRRRDA
jgi:hypothetical protein